MKKTFAACTYYAFKEIESSKIDLLCTSTIGYLEILSKHFETHFAVQSEISFASTKNNTLNIHYFRGKRLHKWQIPFRFNRFIKSLKPDFILVHGFASAHYLIFLKFLCPHAKILLQCNGFHLYPKGVKKIVYQLSDYCIDGYLFTGVENAKDWYENHVFSKLKVFEVMEGSTHFKYNALIKRTSNSFLWVGNLTENKDPMTILRAFALFLEVNSSATLTMIYHQDDLLHDVNRLLKNNKTLKKAVKLCGFIEHSLLEKIYNQHQFFVLGSHAEGSGYALVESMACGCVPIVSSIPSFKFMTNNGNCALLFSPQNEYELYNQLVKSQLVDYQDYQHRVLCQFESALSFEAIAKRVQNIFQSL